jgi:glutamate 5-kinase
MSIGSAGSGRPRRGALIKPDRMNGIHEPPIMTERFLTARRIIVKIGSALLVDPSSGALKQTWLASLADDVERVRQRGSEIIVVTSGAIALGRRMLKLSRGPLKLEESQAAAAVGQIALAQAWREILAERGMTAGQVLLTLYDTEERRRYLNARATLSTLIRTGAVPVINENDAVATSEIRFGDNDRLAARVTAMMSADCLVLLSDVDGLHTAPPGVEGARLVPEVSEITPEIEAMAGRPSSGVGSGGMVTKIEAARIALGGGANMVITSGHHLNPLARLEAGGAATWFLTRASPLQARKRWIAGTLVPVGRLAVDSGAEQALRSGKSLLPAGVVALEGSFSRGDPVSIVSRSGQEFARGLVAYDRPEADRIIGRKSKDIEALLGYRGRDEMVHRDDLVILES